MENVVLCAIYLYLLLFQVTLRPPCKDGNALDLHLNVPLNRGQRSVRVYLFKSF